MTMGEDRSPIRAATFRRQRALLEFALASLLRRPGKTLVLGAILMLIVSLLASLAFLRSSVRLEAATMLREAPDLIVQHVVAGRQEVVPEAGVAAVQAIPGVPTGACGYYYGAEREYTLVVRPTARRR
jgi:predicted lysophospholipase L1 biosynthesis ABC-type transport system permease subunit